MEIIGKIYFVDIKFEKSGKITGSVSSTPNGPEIREVIGIRDEFNILRKFKIIEPNNMLKSIWTFTLPKGLDSIEEILEFICQRNIFFRTELGANEYWNRSIRNQIDSITEKSEKIINTLSKKIK